jgi:hypothetical protein
MRRVLVLLFSLLVAAPPVMAEDVQYIFALPSRMKGELDVVAALSKGISFEPPMVGDNGKGRELSGVYRRRTEGKGDAGTAR